MAMTDAELKANINKMRARIRVDKKESERFDMFSDFQKKTAADITQVLKTNTDLLATAGYGPNSPENAAGTWAIYCSAVSAAMTVAAFFTTAVHVKMRSKEYEGIKLSTDLSEMIVPEAVADLCGHAIMQTFNSAHKFDMDADQLASWALKIVSGIKPVIEGMFNELKGG